MSIEHVEVGGATLLLGDCLDVLRTLPDESVHCCVTSPPYFGLRDYGVEGQLGLEPTPGEFVAALVNVFEEVRRVLRDDGTLWLNLGDSYAGSSHTGTIRQAGLKPKDLIGIPWRVAFALQDAGWYLRQDIIWHKPNPMPESVRDRCTKAHEYLFLLSKSPRYYYDYEAVKEGAVKGAAGSTFNSGKTATHQLGRSSNKARAEDGKRNRRSVWTVAAQPYSGAHFATFPPSLIEPCVLAGSPANGVVLDPFGGAGTVGLVANGLGRQSLLIELNPDYRDLAADRLRDAWLSGQAQADFCFADQAVGL